MVASGRRNDGDCRARQLSRIAVQAHASGDCHVMSIREASSIPSNGFFCASSQDQISFDDTCFGKRFLRPRKSARQDIESRSHQGVRALIEAAELITMPSRLWDIIITDDHDVLRAGETRPVSQGIQRPAPHQIVAAKQPVRAVSFGKRRCDRVEPALIAVIAFQYRYLKAIFSAALQEAGFSRLRRGVAGRPGQPERAFNFLCGHHPSHAMA